MKKSTFIIVLAVLLFPLSSWSQHNHTSISDLNHSDHPSWRVALLIGHTLIPEQHANQNFFIPSWGLDLEYWFSPKVGLGIHNDLEVETFVILRDSGEGDELERITPLVFTLDLLIKPYKGLVLQIGPGYEIEKEEGFPLFRTGIEYEVEFGNHWDISPTVFYDSRFDGGYHTWSIALGVGKRF
jgi:hypothetical protein